MNVGMWSDWNADFLKQEVLLKLKWRAKIAQLIQYYNLFS